jgi:protein-L-isoaspartate(D-aspartate) O-methyltransferase
VDEESLVMVGKEEMVKTIKENYGLDSPGVFEAMKKVPRDQFVPKRYKDQAYKDMPIPIGKDQTMSQPYTVAFMTDLLDLKGNEKVLEVGTGSGYQAAILAELAGRVYSMEIVSELADKAKKNLEKLGYTNVFVKVGSGQKGWKKKAPFDAIIITAGVKGDVPKELINQLKEGGILVAPIGEGYDKQMTRIFKDPDGSIKESKLGVFHFVPFIEE